MSTCKTVGKLCLVWISLLLAVSAAAQQYDSQVEQQLVQSINRERARAGLPSLKVDDRLTQAARAHTVLMAQKEQLSHQFSGELPLQKRLAATGLRFNNDAENVAFDSTVEGAHDGLMHSPPHRANILSPQYNTVGVGVIHSGDAYWVTEDFANRLQEYSVNDAENAIIAAWQRERRHSDLPAASIARINELRNMACAMAKQGRVDTGAPLRLKDVQAAVSYTESDPATLPSNAMKMARNPSVRRIGLGACFASAPRFPSGVWWVCMAFY